MLKNILFHLDTDETTQKQLERDAAPEILRLQKLNLNAFQRYIPSVYQLLVRKEEQTASIFCNKDGDLNIVDRQSSRVLYGMQPRREISTQFTHYCKHAVRYDINDAGRQEVKCHPDLDSPYATKLMTAGPLPEHVGVMVVLGIGLGYHIKMLLEAVQIDHLIIYEPNTSYFRSSISAMPWQHCLDVAKRKNTALYLQIGKDARDLASDISELSQHVPVDHFFLYKHLQHPVFNQVTQALSEHSWPNMKNWVLNANQLSRLDEQVPLWNSFVDLPVWTSSHLDTVQFNANMLALKTYFPAIYQEFSDYTPDKWIPLADHVGNVNIFHKSAVAPLYSETPGDDCRISIDGFSMRPNKDGLVLGYKGKKLQRYFHYQLVKDVEFVLDDIEETHGNLPDVIKSMIVFGLGAGYQLPYLLTSHTIQKLFICEPNRDYFYASLFAIDWASVFKTIDEQGGRLYFNIGDDGSHLINDLLSQFHSVGPHVLANTYFYQGYYNPVLVNAVKQLREQLQVIIAMGDYFDHSRNGIAHTRWAIEHRMRFLNRNAPSLLTQQQKELPVIVIGNGPSLDYLMSVVEEARDEAIIISCGTALQSLHRYGITPDFHAEIEANRSSYDWAVRVGDPDYLKQITLISCNGIHPDTCALFKTTLLALKQGESATVSMTEVYREHPFALLSHAYPTVSNFVCDIVTTMGFSQLYLIGIDMGFVDEKYHHSKSSGYYLKNGQQRYNYAEANDTSLIIEGNLRPFVKTKFEFKVSKTVLEQTFAGKNIEVYNLNDGAKIANTTPLQKENVLIVSSSELKQQTLEVLHAEAFTPFSLDVMMPAFQSRYQHEALVEELEKFKLVIKEDVTTRERAEGLVSALRDFLVASFLRKKSLLFFYLNGTLNFVNSALSKVLNIDDDEVCLDAYNRILAHWRTAFSNIASVLTYDETGLDYIASFAYLRRQLCLREFAINNNIVFRGSTDINQQTFNNMTALFELSLPKETAQESIANFHTIGFASDNHKGSEAYPYQRRCVIHTQPEEFYSAMHTRRSDELLLFLPGDFDEMLSSHICNDYYRQYIALLGLTGSNKLRFILPKMALDFEAQQIDDFFDISYFSSFYVYEGYDYIVFTTEMLNPDEMVMGCGDRLRYLPTLRERDLRLGIVDLETQRKNKNEIRNRFK